METAERELTLEELKTRYRELISKQEKLKVEIEQRLENIKEKEVNLEKEEVRRKKVNKFLIRNAWISTFTAITAIGLIAFEIQRVIQMFLS